MKIAQNKAFGRPQSFVAGPPKNGVQFMAKGLKKIRLDWGLGIRSIRRGDAQHLLSLPRGQQSSRLCFYPFRTLKPRERH